MLCIGQSDAPVLRVQFVTLRRHERSGIASSECIGVGEAELALLLDCAPEKNSRTAGSQLSSPFAWQALETVRSVEVDLGQQHSKSGVTRGNRHASEALRDLGPQQFWISAGARSMTSRALSLR